MDSLISQLTVMKKNVDDLMQSLDIAGKSDEITTLEQQASQPDFWNDSNQARKTMQTLSRLKKQVERWQSVAHRLSDALELADLGDDMLPDITTETEELTHIVDKLSLQAMLSGDYDDENAIFSIYAGAGGEDAQDWAEILERMYLRWMEQNGYETEILDRSEGDGAGIKNVTISVKGEYAYGYLQSEQGVHRLVRLSPFNSASSRETSFAKVELIPDITSEIDIDINPNDLRVDTYRASGAGGQHVQKNDTAVRMTHIPTGVVVQCQNQRSQKQNRDRALQILKARLFELERQKQEAEMAQIKGENVDAAWGQQIRNYVMHPYQLVKDTRTGYEVGNINAVLDGALDDFMDSYLRYRVGSPQK